MHGTSRSSAWAYFNSLPLVIEVLLSCTAQAQVITGGWELGTNSALSVTGETNNLQESIAALQAAGARGAMGVWSALAASTNHLGEASGLRSVVDARQLRMASVAGMGLPALDHGGAGSMAVRDRKWPGSER